MIFQIRRKGPCGSGARTAPAALVCLLFAGGCAEPKQGPVVFYLDGAGWYSSADSVKQGLRDAGYEGEFSTFSWSAYLGPAHDHFVNASSKGIARRLAGRIEKARRDDPGGRITVMGLSAGTVVVLGALEVLPQGVQVDDVVLLSSSASSQHDLTRAMGRVRRNLYATCSPHDGILGGMVINADGKPGPPAGRVGFRMPRKRDDKTKAAYDRVINLQWRPTYLAFDWDGGHTSVTNRKLVASVIAPRLFSEEPFPLDRSVTDRVAARNSGG
ncbi:MAG: alpha/beta hydrolase [Planctomycetota bacterium]